MAIIITLFIRLSTLRPVSRKPWKLFRPPKPFLVIGTLKSQKCIGLKLCMEGTSVHIKLDAMEQNSSAVIKFVILLWVSKILR